MTCCYTAIKMTYNCTHELNMEHWLLQCPLSPASNRYKETVILRQKKEKKISWLLIAIEAQPEENNNLGYDAKARRPLV